MAWAIEYNNLLTKYAKPIIHMRAQNRNRRLSLMLGSGVSKPCGIPDWDELVRQIAEEIKGEAIIASQKHRSSITSKIQVLFEHFQRKECISENINQDSQAERVPFIDPRIKKRWHEIIRGKLYGNLELKDSDKVFSFHPYLGTFTDIIRESPMTINYNFDDLIERMLSELNKDNGRPIGEGFESVWDVNLQFKSNSSIIYHPNGYLPRDLLEKSSDWLVFSEDEYADQLIYSMTGYFSTLAHHLSKNTCLLIGLSLEDSTLRHLLRQNARINPGHYHYCIAFVEDGQKLDSEVMESITNANFDVYNLITLFLTSEEIKALGELITMEDGNFGSNAQKEGHNIKFCFYISGAIGVGKSTVISYFRSLQTHDEWTEQRPIVLAKPPDRLEKEEREEADNWIASQFYRKNWDLCVSQEGIHIVDRPPLDPLGFTKETEWPEKANFILVTICSSIKKVEPGRVVLLINEPAILETRIKTSQQDYNRKDIEEQQNKLLKVYSLSAGVTVIKTTGLTINEVVKSVARIIHMEEYKPVAQLHEIFETIIKEPENV